MDDELDYGLVKIVGGIHKGRIGYYDDDSDCGQYGIIYFGSIFKGSGSYFVRKRFLSLPTTDDLLTRRNALMSRLAIGKPKQDTKIDLLSELSIIDHELHDRIFSACFKAGSGKKVFISHSSKDKHFAVWLATDLTRAGHSPWLDDWKIRVGDSIPREISLAVKASDAVVVLLTENAIASRWVENEWQAKYWDEVNEGNLKVLPALMTKCEVPTLLKTKKYADFQASYNEGLESLLFALQV